MLLACSLILLLALAAFFAMHRSSLRLRLAVASAVFVAPIFAVSALMIWVGDQATPGSTIIYQRPK